MHWEAGVGEWPEFCYLVALWCPHYGHGQSKSPYEVSVDPEGGVNDDSVPCWTKIQPCE